MSDPGTLVWIFVSALLINNFTLSYFLGLCPFFGVSGGSRRRSGSASPTSSCW